MGIDEPTHRWEYENTLVDIVEGLVMTADGSVFETVSPLDGIASGKTDGLNDNYNIPYDIGNPGLLVPESGDYTIVIGLKPNATISGTTAIMAKGNDSSARKGWSMIFVSGGSVLRLGCNFDGSTAGRAGMDRTGTYTATKQQIILIIDRTNNVIRGAYNGSDSGFVPNATYGNDITGFGSILSVDPFKIGERSALNDFHFGGLVDKVIEYKGYAFNNTDITNMWNGGNWYQFPAPAAFDRNAKKIIQSDITGKIISHEHTPSKIITPSNDIKKIIN